jgi:hypothetical protein
MQLKSVNPASTAHEFLRKFLGFYYEKRTAHWYIVTSLLLKPLKQRLIDVTSFWLS